MQVHEKVKELRGSRGWSQEQMAEKLGVSRQAVTKWETGAGMPDIENLAAIARLFGVSTDALIFGEGAASADAGEGAPNRFESVTLVDVAEERHYDIRVGCARSVVVRSCEGEKVMVRLVADSIVDLDRAFKVVLDTEGRSLDIDVTNTGIVADVLARQQLDVEIELPAAFTADAEIELHADELRVQGIRADLEVGGKVGLVRLADVDGHVELDVPVDMEIWADGIRGRLDVNQVGATSVLHVAHDAPFTAQTHGHLGKRTLRFTRDGQPAEAPKVEDAPLAIELAGARCELTVDSVTRPGK